MLLRILVFLPQRLWMGGRLAHIGSPMQIECDVLVSCADEWLGLKPGPLSVCGDMGWGVVIHQRVLPALVIQCPTRLVQSSLGNLLKQKKTR